MLCRFFVGKTENRKKDTKLKHKYKNERKWRKKGIRDKDSKFNVFTVSNGPESKATYVGSLHC
jgi:hypothetical protein